MYILYVYLDQHAIDIYSESDESSNIGKVILQYGIFWLIAYYKKMMWTKLLNQKVLINL